MLYMCREERESPRARTSVFINRYVGESPIMSRVIDVSVGGVRLQRLIEPSYKEETVQLEMLLPGERRPLWLKARVVRHELVESGEVTALRFVELSDRARRVLEHYVERTHGVSRSAA